MLKYKGVTHNIGENICKSYIWLWFESGIQNMLYKKHLLLNNEKIGILI